MVTGQYELLWDDQGELRRELDALGLQHVLSQRGGSSGQVTEVLDSIISYIELKDVLTGAVSGLAVLTVEKVVDAVHRVVGKRKIPDPEQRNVVSVTIYEHNQFYCAVRLDVDEKPTDEAIRESLETARQAHLAYLKSQHEDGWA
jgi:hypothetical protein